MAADASVVPGAGADDIEQLPAASPGDELAARLDDPRIRSSLTQILDHADMLATMVVAVDGLLRRAEVISDSLSSGVAEIRDAVAGPAGSAPWSGIDVAAVSQNATRLSSALVAGLPAVERVLRSPLADPKTADLLANMGEALLQGQQAAAADRHAPRGVFALLRAARDPDVSRGLGFMIQIARAFGRQLATSPASATGPRRSS